MTRYVVHYRLASGSGGDETEPVDQDSTSIEITSLTQGETYIFSVASTATNQLPGESEEMTITLGEWLQLVYSHHFLLPLSTVGPPDTPNGVIAAAESDSSVRVYWQTVDDADRYIVTFFQVQGTDGLQCHCDSHTASLTVDGSSTTVSIAVAGDVESTVTDMLRAYTTYEVTVTAVSDRRGTSQPSTVTELQTPQTSENCVSVYLYIPVFGCAGPGEAPGNVRAEAVSSTEISVQWNGLSTSRLVNGLIVSYRVQFTVNDATETRDRELRDGEDWRSGGDMLLTGLTPFTNYSIEVAAVNENGDVGLYSDPITAVTRQCKVV